MRIKQFYCGLDFFKEGMKKKYNFTDRTDLAEPLFILGCYGWQAWSNICFKHESLVVLCFAGEDLHNLAKPVNTFWVNEFKKRPNIKFIASNTWMANELDKIGLPYYKIAVTPFLNDDIQPCPLGDSIYVYKPNVESYGSELYHKVKERLPYKFIESEGFTRTREEILQCYRNSFMGLRLMESGGLAVTVIELGLMGRMCLHNGDHPNCIHYDKNNVDGIVDTINSEYRKAEEGLRETGIDGVDDIAKSVRDFLNIGEDFLNTDFYE
jgi:hypothetical protein